MSRKAYLSALNLDQLTSCVDVLCRLSDAGRILQDAGYDPRFALLPGCRPTMSIDIEVPEIWAPPEAADMAAFEAVSAGPAVTPVSEDEAMEPFLPWAGQTSVIYPPPPSAADIAAFEAAKAGRDPGPADYATMVENGRRSSAHSARLDVTGPLIIEHADPVYDEDPETPRTASQSEGTAFVAVSGEGGREGVAAILPANPSVDAAPAPGSASAQAANRPAPWTEDEDAQAVSLYVQGLRLGATQRAAGLNVAHQLARSIEGVLFRLKNKLAPAVEAALQAKAVAADVQNAATPLTPTGELQAYLAGLPRKLGREDWPLASDLSLIELSTQGFGKQDIAVDMGVDAKLIGERFDLLTGQHRDADGKLVRGWKTRDVLAALQALTPAQA